MECYFRMLQGLFLRAGAQAGLTRFSIILLVLLFLLMSGMSTIGGADEADYGEAYAELAPMNSDFVKMMSDPLNSPYRAEIIPSPVYRKNQGLLASELELNLYGMSADAASGELQAQASSTYERLPQSFSLRQYSKTPLIGNQGSCDAGWAFASLGSLLSSLLPQYTERFSQNHLKNTNGFDLGPCGGGNADIATAYLARWNGPVSAFKDPYSADSAESPSDLPVLAHLDYTLVVPTAPQPGHPSIIELMKKIIMNEGALYGAFYSDEIYYLESDRLTTYYNPNPLGGSPNDIPANETGTYQGMLIVGWDDSIKRTDFSVSPPANGAFLVQNSLGNKWGMNGYFYLSYYDVAFSQMNPVSFTAASADDYDNMYEYDPYGYCQSYGAAESYAFANVFRAQRNEVISGVGFYSTNPNAYYTIEIYKNSDYLDLENATPVYVQTGYQGLSGYYTIPLVTPVPVNKNDYFAAAIKITTPGRWYPVAVEIPIGGYSSAATSLQGQSYVSKDGVYWEDFAQLYTNGNVCLKVFTNGNAGSRILPFPNSFGGYYPLSNDLDRDGKYEDIDGNYILDYNDVTVLFENLEFAMTSQPVWAFDFDENGFIGYGDVSTLLEMVL